jgi:CHAT domain-containing protein
LEIDAINKLLVSKKWKTTVLKQMHAQEYKVKSVSNPVLLHMATHGFSLNGNEGGSHLENLLNSGIVLAGAGDNTALNDEDGVLTAYEMMNMMLDSTQLVVLSACETGLGEYHNGEGIYGLQAALRSAGVRFVVMSLWKVDDNATQQLMTNFYKAWINSPSDPRAAFRKAQQELRKSFPDPYFWGAFVMTGN